jgi:hypothetical protein
LRKPEGKIFGFKLSRHDIPHYVRSSPENITVSSAVHAMQGSSIFDTAYFMIISCDQSKDGILRVQQLMDPSHQRVDSSAWRKEIE